MPCCVYWRNKAFTEASSSRIKLEKHTSNVIILMQSCSIDNRNELSSKLNIPLDPPASNEDLIQCAYERWGIDCSKKILGDFSFALWDDKHQHIFCARDSLGIKPFYYSLNLKQFLFSDNIDDILSHPDISFQLDEPFVAGYLKDKFFANNERTFFADIKNLLLDIQ